MVPADNKPFARLVVAGTIVKALNRLDLAFPKVKGKDLAELKKVEWPGQNQVIQGTVVVLVACLVVGVYLYVNDIVWKHVVSKVFLGQ